MRSSGSITSVYSSTPLSQGQILSWVQTVLSFPSSALVARELSLPYYSPIVGEGEHDFLPFLRALAKSETETVLSRI